jgi:hypothetical protein
VWSKNKTPMTAQERAHVGRVKALPCGVCGSESDEAREAHEIEQGKWFLSIPLCADCHRGSFNGLHGQKRMWAAMKLNENDVLNDTIRKLTQ